MKKANVKKMKETGWYDFVQWAIGEGFTADQLNGNLLTHWHCYKQTLELLGKIEKDLYQTSNDFRLLQFQGLKRQLGPKKS